MSPTRPNPMGGGIKKWDETKRSQEWPPVERSGHNEAYKKKVNSYTTPFVDTNLLFKTGKNKEKLQNIFTFFLAFFQLDDSQ